MLSCGSLDDQVVGIIHDKSYDQELGSITKDIPRLVGVYIYATTKEIGN